MKIGRWTFSEQVLLVFLELGVQPIDDPLAGGLGADLALEEGLEASRPLIHGGLDLADRGDESCGRFDRRRLGRRFGGGADLVADIGLDRRTGLREARAQLRPVRRLRLSSATGSAGKRPISSGAGSTRPFAGSSSRRSVWHMVAPFAGSSSSKQVGASYGSEVGLLEFASLQVTLAGMRKS